ncbi:MAG: sodium/proline symporter, partial [Gemmatimonadetes bacterium]|nr:sodium/proline symporter [Gemmatimonadota bacterium]
GLYLVAILIVGFVTWRRMKSLDDFVLGGRKLSPFAAALSERASGESAWFLLGLPGAAYVAGFAEFWTVIGSSFGIFVSWLFIAKLLNRQSRNLGALTLPDYFESRFRDDTRLLRIVAMAIILFFYTAYVGAQFVGAGKILNATFGIQASTGMILGAIVVVFYTFMGGFLAVVWTDVVQGLLMMVVAVLLPILGIMALGGPSGLVEAIVARSAEDFAGGAEAAGSITFGADALRMTGGKVGWGLINGVMFGGMMWGIGYLGQPHLLARYMAIRSPDEVDTGRKFAVSWVLLSYWGAAFVGIAAIGLLPDLAHADREQVMPLLALKLLPAWLAGLAIAGAIAAMMSTADSQLLVATSAIIEDVYVKIFKPAVSPERLVLYSRFATVVIAGVALYLAFRSQEFVFKSVEYAWTGLASSFAPALLLSLRWKRFTRWGALAGMLAGTVSTVVWKNSEALSGVLDIKLATFLIALIAAVGVALVTPARGQHEEA